MMGFEPTASWATTRRSDQLSYTHRKQTGTVTIAIQAFQAFFCILDKLVNKNQQRPCIFRPVETSSNSVHSMEAPRLVRHLERLPS